jgi:transcriptional regulator with GAF, ATPase, and Fis domain
MPDLPPRYEPKHRLGAGGGGEVWSVRDRVSGQVLALKVLSSDAGAPEVDALVREAVALSGLEGLGVPRVVAFGALADGRRYMVRELVEGHSLEDVLQAEEGPWLEPIASACEQLTVVHRAGLLHGDLKPGNIIVGEGGRGTLVDLGLAAPWREGGTRAQGLTPKYAAPELFEGEPLTVRAEVYALGATLSEAVARRGDELEEDVRLALAKVAARATEAGATSRWPSVDELASALRLAAGLPPSATGGEPAWPVLGIEDTSRSLLEKARALPPGSAIALEGPRGSGRTTLAHRLAWSLGVEGTPVALIEAPKSGMAMGDAVELELAQFAGAGAGAGAGGAGKGAAPVVVIVDDGSELDEASKKALRKASAGGARLVVVGPRAVVAPLAQGPTATVPVPPLDTQALAELVQRSVPSLPDALRAHLIARVGGRPGALRGAVRQLAGQAIVSKEDVDAALGTASRPSIRPVPTGREEMLDSAESSLAMGRFDEAARDLDALGEAKTDGERVRVALARARIAVGRGDLQRAFADLEAVEKPALGGPHRRAWLAMRARVCLRAGQHADAVKLAQQVVDAEGADALASDALSVRGLALALTGEDGAARQSLDEAVRLARVSGEPRVEAVALGSAAIVHQRAGRTADARASYEESLAAAEKARDAATVAATRLNLASLAQAEGDLSQALVHLEAAVDMGQRAGSAFAVTQGLLNLANLDLYLGRWERARGSIDRLAARRAELSPSAHAQLTGLEAEHAARTGDVARGAALYETTARAWEAQGRTHDAAESHLEGLLTRAREGGTSARALAAQLDSVRASLGEAGFGRHAALAELVRGSIAHLAGDEDAARRALDASIDLAREAGRREWAWQALDARARLAAAQGSFATARRDTEAALAMLEETAAKLPRDLREVFWDDPRRRALRQAHTATVVAPGVLSTGLGAGPATGSGPGLAPATASRDGSASVHRAPPAFGGTTSIFSGPRLAEDRLARILEITRELASEHDVPRLLQRVTDHAVALLGAERGLVVLLSESGQLEAHAARVRSGADEPHARFSRSVADRVVESGEPVVTISARDDARLAEAVSVHKLMIQSVACVPIRGAPPLGRTIGALYVETRVRTGVRFEEELPTLRAFADQAAIAIENARLLAENRARADELARANADLASAHDEVARLLGKRTVQLAEARRDLKQARAELRSHFGYAGLVGTSAAMRRLYALIDRVKDTDVPVLITGESGTGKEIVARAVHLAGPRVKKPFLGVNCGAIPANLLESELFGSIKGAFTGADRDRRGLFQEADGGTLLLDEIGEMPPKMQAGLLRVLQEKCVRPVGGTLEEPVDVRVVAATHRDLQQMVAEGTFREDLFYRLHVVELHVPALRERVEDIPPLIDHFLSLFAARYRRDRKTLSRDALRKLCAYPWPGNVRQLEHVLLSAWLMSEKSDIPAADVELPSPLTRATSPAAAGSMGATGTDRRARTSAAPTASAQVGSQAEFKAAERERILSALAACNWNRVQAAKMIGVPRRTFYRRLKEFGIL